MSIHSITIAEFMSLDRRQLRLAVRLCDQEITALRTLVGHVRPESPEYEDALAEISSAITLRKVHKARLDELEAEAAAETDGASLQTAA